MRHVGMRLAVWMASAAIPAGVAQAQTAAPNAGGPVATTDEIIVTAQKRSERLQDVPLSITAVTGAQLAKQGITSAADLEKIAPGFTYRLSQNGTPVFAIRGIGFYSEQVANAPTVTIYTDQIPLPYARMAEGAALDVERVEVLKGPQGTLFGQNSTGGAVNYVAAKPTNIFHAGGQVTFGRFDQADESGYISGPLMDGLSARLAASHESRGDWQESSTRSASSGQHEFTAGRLLVDWTGISKLKVELNINGWRDGSDTQQSQARGYLPVAGGPPLTPQTIATANALTHYPYVTSNNDRLADWDAGGSYRRNDKFYQIAANVQYELTDHVRLISISAYSDLSAFAPIDADGTNYPALFITQKGEIRTITEELRLEGDSGPLKWVVGGNYEHDVANEEQVTIIRGSNSQLPLPPPAPALSFNGINLFNDQKVEAKAGFGSVDFRITPQWSIQGGVRYTAEDRSFAGCLADNGTPTGFGKVLGLPLTAPDLCVTFLPSGAPGQYKTALNQDNVSWRGGVNWKPHTDTLVYFNVTKGYKSGDFGTLPAVSYLQFQPVQQESVVAYEGGFKTSLLHRTADISGAIFYDDYRNKQTQGSVFVAPFGNLPYLVNVPKSRILGAELDLSVRPIEGLKISAGVTYLDTEIQDTAIVESPFGQSINAHGEALPNAPKWQAEGDAEYDFPVAQDMSGFVGASVSWRTDSYAALGATTGPAGTQDNFKIDGYGLLDLRGGLEIGKKYRIQVWAKNVTNRGYWNNVVHIYDTYARITGLPATYGVTIAARF
ncbi:MAG TPA: TonB-dependent receptor [Caulobacteraceae bacterium]